jgi:hypothetical protein
MGNWISNDPTLFEGPPDRLTIPATFLRVTAAV